MAAGRGVEEVEAREEVEGWELREGASDAGRLDMEVVTFLEVGREGVVLDATPLAGGAMIRLAERTDGAVEVMDTAGDLVVESAARGRIVAEAVDEAASPVLAAGAPVAAGRGLEGRWAVAAGGAGALLPVRDRAVGAGPRPVLVSTRGRDDGGRAVGGGSGRGPRRDAALVRDGERLLASLVETAGDIATLGPPQMPARATVVPSFGASASRSSRDTSISMEGYRSDGVESRKLETHHRRAP